MQAHNPDDVVRYFGGARKTQAKFGLRSRQTVYYWLTRPQMPLSRAMQAEELSGGHLKFDKSVYLDS